MADADKFYRAIAENRKIGFRYFHYTPNPNNPKRFSKSGDRYVVSPYALLWDNGNFYLYAYLTERNAFRTFRIDRMEDIDNTLTEKRDGEKAFKTDQLTAQEYKVFQMYHGEKMKVRVRFSNHLADAVIDQFGKNVMLIPEDEKHFTATLPVEISHFLRGLRPLDVAQKSSILIKQSKKCVISLRDLQICIKMMGRSSNFSPYCFEMMIDDGKMMVGCS